MCIRDSDNPFRYRVNNFIIKNYLLNVKPEMTTLLLRSNGLEAVCMYKNIRPIVCLLDPERLLAVVLIVPQLEFCSISRHSVPVSYTHLIIKNTYQK